VPTGLGLAEAWFAQARGTRQRAAAALPQMCEYGHILPLNPLDGPNGSHCMNVFTTIVPDAPEGAGPTFVVSIIQDAETRCWIGTSDDIPLATEAPTLDQLIERVWLIAPEVAELNGIPARDMRLRFVMDTQPVPQ
jgi:Domain of unknown function (DUF1902)